MSNAINWFEILITDMDRAIKFYSKVFSYPLMHRMQMHEVDMALFIDSEGSRVAFHSNK